MSERQEKKTRYNQRLQYIAEFIKWQDSEPPMWRVFKYRKWKQERPVKIFKSGLRHDKAFAPIIDAVPVVHGEWIPSESDFDDDDALFDVEDWCDWQCSACHADICYEDPMERRWLPKYCPNCGAKMDGGNDAENH